MSTTPRLGDEHLNAAPADRAETESLARRWAKRSDLPKEDLAAIDADLAKAFPGGFTYRDEANALIAMAVRNGPIEDLHAGRHSELLEDHDLSRITDGEMRVLMIYASRMLSAMLSMRDNAPVAYRRHLQAFAKIYCDRWERWQ